MTALGTKSYGRWIVAMFVPPAFATLIAVAWDAPTSRRSAEPATAAQKPVDLPAPKPQQIPTPSPAGVAAPPATPRRIAPPVATAQVDRSLSFETLSMLWADQPADTTWTAAFTRNLSSVLEAAKLSPGLVRETDCRQTLCRFVIDASGAAGFVVKENLERNHREFRYTREEVGGEAQYVALVFRDGKGSEATGTN